MYRKEFLVITLVAVVLFLAVAGAGWSAILKLQNTSKMLVVDTLPGLVDTGQAIERMNDNRRTMFGMLNARTGAERAQLLALVRTNSTDTLWSDYTTSIFEPEDRQNYQAMVLVRSNYLQGCEAYFEMLSVGKTNEASNFFYGDLSRNFRSYNEAAKKLFNYNVRQGKDRGEIIIHITSFSLWVIAGVSVFLFVIGLFFGMRYSLFALHYVLRRDK